MVVDEMIAFIRARLDELEAVALAAPGSEWSAYQEDSIAGASVYDEEWVLLYPEHYDHDNVLSNKPGATGPMYIELARDELCAHIARHDPARVLADVAMRRTMVSNLRTAIDHGWQFGEEAREVTTQLAVMMLQRFAALDANHPDYDPGWAL